MRPPRSARQRRAAEWQIHLAPHSPSPPRDPHNVVIPAQAGIEWTRPPKHTGFPPARTAVRNKFVPRHRRRGDARLDGCHAQPGLKKRWSPRCLTQNLEPPSSSPRKRGSSAFRCLRRPKHWIPAFAGMTPGWFRRPGAMPWTRPRRFRKRSGQQCACAGMTPKRCGRRVVIAAAGAAAARGARSGCRRESAPRRRRRRSC